MKRKEFCTRKKGKQGYSKKNNYHLGTAIRYTDQQYDEQTEQYYLRVRYYNYNPVFVWFMQEKGLKMIVE